MKWTHLSLRVSQVRNSNPNPIESVFGSVTGAFPCVTVVSVEKLFTVVDPSRFTSIVSAKPSVVSLVSMGMVPAGSENRLKANVLPDVETPSGAESAGP